MDKKISFSEKCDYLALSIFLHEIENVVIHDGELSYRQAFILNDLACQLRDSYTVLDIEKKYNNKK